MRNYGRLAILREAERLQERLLLSAANPLLLSSLDGTNGFRINGIDASDFSGFSVSDAGDVNGDGYGDLIVGALQGDAGSFNSGESYVVFGKSEGFAASINLSSLDGNNGFRLDGVAANERSGRSVSSAGDVNGDGFDDLMIGAPSAAGGGNYAGQSYVVFGKSSGFTATLSLSTLNGTNGFRLNGIANYDSSGISVGSAGDVNGDGFDDLIIGADFANAGGTRSGESYVVFGKASGFGSVVDLASLDGSNGFQISGVDAYDRSGYSVSTAGDVNGDGFDDLIIGAKGDSYSPSGTTGESYVVFGKASGFTAELELWTLNGTNGFRLNGVDDGDRNGISVSNAGDINGDGFDDVIVGAYLADAGGNQSGESYVVFGKSGGFASVINLSTVDGTNGFLLAGIDDDDFAGLSVSGAGDVNGDGFDDLIIGAQGGDAGANDTGESYVVFGKAGGFAATLLLSSLDGLNGFRIEGIDANDYSGFSVSSAGDVNGDGFSDMIIGAHHGDAGAYDTGESYVIFGDNFSGGTETQVGTNVSDTLNAAQGATARDVLIGGLGDDTLTSDGGPDVLLGGRGDDILVISDADFSSTRRIVGGSGRDTLRLAGSGTHLDLTAIRDNRIVDIEEIDITGSGSNSLTLNAREVLNLSTDSNTLIVRRDLNDVVNIGAGWIANVDKLIGGNRFAVFRQGAATLKLQYPATLNLSQLDGSNGYRLVGVDANDHSGFSVSRAGDVNGDGFDDVFIGAYQADGGASSSGESYVVFGKRDGFASSLNLSTLNGSNGFRIVGVDLNDRSGFCVSDAGDVNGDGFDDLHIGAPYGDAGGTSSGESYVVFGKSTSFAPALNLSSLSGTDGFRLDGAHAGDQSGVSVSSAGDVNGDGFSDLIIGSRRNDVSGTDSGESYVVFGKASGFASSIQLSTLNGTNGFRISGIDPFDYSGRSVSSAGDVNGDGFGDLIIGAFRADGGGDSSGESYVVFGKASGFASVLLLSSLNGANGFKLNGATADDLSGRSVSNAGDINGDGFGDVIVGAFRADGGAATSGVSYVVFGKASGFSASINLATLNGTDGFRLEGIDQNDLSGRSVSGAGDFNGDGIDDLVIGAVFGDAGGSNSGESYVIFGKSEGFTSAVSLSSLNGRTGVRLDGIRAGDLSGSSVSAAGDVNGDGFDDLIIGAYKSNSGATASGESFVIFGGTFASRPETQVGTVDSDTIMANQGEEMVDILIGGAGDDVLLSDGGPDVIRGGQGNDIVAIPDATVLSAGRLIGGTGTDTLRLDGSGIVLDLTLIADNRIVDFEVIDITGIGENTLIVDPGEVLNLSTHSNTLIVHRDEDDVVDLGSGWTQGVDQPIGDEIFNVYTQGRATVLVRAVNSLTGTNSNDAFVLTYSSTTLDGTVTVTRSTGGAAAVPLGTFSMSLPFFVNGLGGTDSIKVVGSSGNDYITATSSKLLINRAELHLTSIETRTLAAGLGDDTYKFDADAPLGTFRLEEQPLGTDTISFNLTTSVNVTIDLGTTATQVVNSNLSLVLNSAQRFENATGGSGNDTLIGNILANTLRGNSGNDVMIGGPGSDSLLGGPGNDTYEFSSASSAESDSATESANAGIDTLSFGNLSTALNVNLGTSLLQTVHLNRTLKLNASSTFENVIGGSADDTIQGNSLDNLLNGNAGNDILTGGAGSDSLLGGIGDDVYNFANATAFEADKVTEGTNAGTDTLSFSRLTTALNLNIGTSLLQTVHFNRSLKLNSYATFENVIGSAADDIIRGNSLANNLNGRSGHDILIGNEGDDQLFGSNGLDILIGGLGHDSINGGADDDILIGGRTTSDGSVSRLMDLRNEWISGRAYSVRVVNLRRSVGISSASLRAGVNVFDDNEDDDLTGSSGTDWYFKAIDDELFGRLSDEMIDLL